MEVPPQSCCLRMGNTCRRSNLQTSNSSTLGWFDNEASWEHQLNLRDIFLPNRQAHLNGKELLRRFAYVYFWSFILKWLGIGVGAVFLAANFFDLPGLPWLRAGAIALFLYVNYKWALMFYGWFKPTLSEASGKLLAWGWIGVLYLTWNRLRFGLIQDGVEAACDAVMGYFLTAVISEVPFWEMIVMGLVLIGDLAVVEDMLNEMTTYETMCIESTRKHHALF